MSFAKRTEKIFKSVGVDNYEQCLEWAFGEKWRSTKMSAWPHEWNRRHRDLFIVCGSDDMGKSFQKIGRIFLQRETR